MIVKASQRSGGHALAAHLLNIHDNDHVEVHSIKGLTASDVTGAFVEIEAMSRATRCKQPFFSVSISPPKGETVVNADFENAIAQIAATMGLADQPRVILFHEKEARRHCHVVFSRIDAAQVKAINLPFFKRRLTEISRELYLTHGFDLPKGLSDASLANPLNFSLEEWQVAKRAKRDPREIKAALKQCWERSDSGTAFATALKERGFWLCRGDRRGFVTLDYKGTVYSLSRWLDVKAKDLTIRLGDPDHHNSVQDTKAEIDATVSDVVKRLLYDMERRRAETMRPLLDQRRRIVERQRGERTALLQTQKARREAQALVHAQRFRRGLRGLWDWVIGRRKSSIRTIQTEVAQASIYEDAQHHSLRIQHRAERHALQAKIETQRNSHREHQTSLFNETKCKTSDYRQDRISMDCSRISRGDHWQKHTNTDEHDLR